MKNMKSDSNNNKRVILLSEKECKVIRNLIEAKIEELDLEKDNLEDPEYGVLYHIKIGLLNSILEKHFKLEGPGMMDRSATDDFLKNMEDNKL